MHAVEIVISDLLRVGVILSLSIVFIGTVLTFIHHPDYISSAAELHRLTTPGAQFPQDAADVISGLTHLQGRAVVILGLLLLIATPVMRVAVSIFAFVYEEDPPFVVITSIVLLLLLLSFVLGKAEG
jgi:uncharacterized membrane protein